ncbi:unnamed protein product [Blepharisma stoltei]|uniref:Uncharacterized protein n=1 Tax=Blepharisma stoltei TaxID=1481888 RepID=A0AAU9I7N5_9CILI|nr:unnamed protein product [Blepharisma stoltei]
MTICGYLFLGSSIIYYLFLISLIIKRKKEQKLKSLKKEKQIEVTLSSEATARGEETIPTFVDEGSADNSPQRKPKYKGKKTLTIEIPADDEETTPEVRILPTLWSVFSRFFSEQCFPLSIFQKEKETFIKSSRLAVWYMTFSIECLILFIFADQELFKVNSRYFLYPFLSCLICLPVSILWTLGFRSSQSKSTKILMNIFHFLGFVVVVLIEYYSFTIDIDDEGLPYFWIILIFLELFVIEPLRTSLKYVGLGFSRYKKNCEEFCLTL